MSSDRMRERVGHHMTPDVMWTAPDAPLAKVMRRMNQERIRHALVVAPAALRKDEEIPKKAIVGILSSRDVLRKLEDRPEDAIRLTNYSVHEVMTPAPLHTIGPEEPLSEAARIMVGKRVSALPVLLEDTLIGVLTTDDILLASSLIETLAD